jgi:hypothetical protein
MLVVPLTQEAMRREDARYERTDRFFSASGRASERRLAYDPIGGERWALAHLPDTSRMACWEDFIGMGEQRYSIQLTTDVEPWHAAMTAK